MEAVKRERMALFIASYLLYRESPPAAKFPAAA